MAGLSQRVAEMLLLGVVGIAIYLFRAEILEFVAKMKAPKLADDGLKMFG
jgi:hypothetical protein